MSKSIGRALFRVKRTSRLTLRNDSLGDKLPHGQHIHIRSWERKEVGTKASMAKQKWAGYWVASLGGNPYNSRNTPDHQSEQRQEKWDQNMAPIGEGASPTPKLMLEGSGDLGLLDVVLESQKTMSKEGFCANKAKEFLTNTLGCTPIRHELEGMERNDLMDRKEREWNKEGSESSGQIQRRKTHLEEEKLKYHQSIAGGRKKGSGYCRLGKRGMTTARASAQAKTRAQQRRSDPHIRK
ncbi:hypothetical protein PPACK8108_LOCUS17045 [Phakopsora pachyrhizi]|uniref:Uncharacterized protein n=1 Tax=Phakopsora pachyrhizi TaxID=170000 RepID=A0AAV0B8Q8_PHAPC|nr:hypothetical protein PPACK8108_LOCUS17045 [Phakopsora pachyrhizi]